MAGAVFGDLGVSLFVAGAAFGDLGVPLFVAGAVFGDLGVSLFVAGAALGDVGVSLFVAGTVFGEICVDSRSAKCCIFQYKMRLRSSANGRVRDDEFMVGSCSDRSRVGIDASTVFGEFFVDFGVQFCVAGAVFGEVGG